MAFAFGEQRHQYIRTGDFIATRGLHVDCGPLYDPLEPCGRFRIAAAVSRQPCKVLVQELA